MVNASHKYGFCFSSKHLIKNALKSNDFLKNLDKSQVHEIINCMYEECVAAGNYIIRENEAGNHLYVSAGENDCDSLLRLMLSHSVHFVSG